MNKIIGQVLVVAKGKSVHQPAFILDEINHADVKNQIARDIAEQLIVDLSDEYFVYEKIAPNTYNHLGSVKLVWVDPK